MKYEEGSVIDNTNAPNAVTLAALEAAADGKDLHGPYESVRELMEALEKDE